MSSENRVITLSPHFALKNLEAPYLYDLEKDELYELSPDAYQFLLQCAQGHPPSLQEKDREFIQYCLSEHLIHYSEFPFPRKVFPEPSPIPSLRYLELQVTDRCNLRCKHCYLAEGSYQDLSLERVLTVFKEFEEIQGLRMLISGGEPLLHPEFWALNEVLRDYSFRSVLLSNGTLISRKIARKLLVHEVQVSLDGMKEGHEALRGKGTFKKTLLAIDYLQDADIRVSIATMIHKRNLKEFDQLASLIQSKNIEEWNVDVPCVEGRLKENNEFRVSPSEAAPLLSYGFGGGFHGSENNATCGAHLCAIIPEGTICKCGLFSQDPVGTIEEGLRVCWERIPRISLSDLKCNCSEIKACRGGCRYRARIGGNLYEPDLFQCYARGIAKGGEVHDD